MVMNLCLGFRFSGLKFRVVYRGWLSKVGAPLRLAKCWHLIKPMSVFSETSSRLEALHFQFHQECLRSAVYSITPIRSVEHRIFGIGLGGLQAPEGGRPRSDGKQLCISNLLVLSRE